MRPPASLVQTAKVTRWRQPGQPPGTCRHGSHQGSPEVSWKTLIQYGDVLVLAR